MEAGMEPGGREPAPGELRLVQSFINTNDIEDGRETLGSPEQLGAWLARHDLTAADLVPTEEDLRTALEVREALRAVAGANTGETPDRGAVEALNRIASDLGLVLRFNTDGRSWLEAADGGVRGALGAILARVYTAMIDGTWTRLKVCRNDECRWVFYDHSKNRSGAWCTMAMCGDKLKARAYRQRRRAGA